MGNVEEFIPRFQTQFNRCGYLSTVFAADDCPENDRFPDKNKTQQNSCLVSPENLSVNSNSHLRYQFLFRVRRRGEGCGLCDSLASEPLFVTGAVGQFM